LGYTWVGDFFSQAHLVTLIAESILKGLSEVLLPSVPKASLTLPKARLAPIFLSLSFAHRGVTRRDAGKKANDNLEAVTA
jgi:hypothetical protein